MQTGLLPFNCDSHLGRFPFHLWPLNHTLKTFPRYSGRKWLIRESKAGLSSFQVVQRYCGKKPLISSLLQKECGKAALSVVLVCITQMAHPFLTDRGRVLAFPHLVLRWNWEQEWQVAAGHVLISKGTAFQRESEQEIHFLENMRHSSPELMSHSRKHFSSIIFQGTL